MGLGIREPIVGHADTGHDPDPCMGYDRLLGSRAFAPFLFRIRATADPRTWWIPHAAYLHARRLGRPPRSAQDPDIAPGQSGRQVPGPCVSEHFRVYGPRKAIALNLFTMFTEELLSALRTEHHVLSDVDVAHPSKVRRSKCFGGFKRRKLNVPKHFAWKEMIKFSVTVPPNEISDARTYF